ncbi:MAG: 3D domain-containing protein [Nitrosopumilus sp.]
MTLQMFKGLTLFFFILLIVNFNNVQAYDVGIPEWVFNVYDFWTEEKISDKEFTNMLTYLEKWRIIEFPLNEEYDIKTNFLLNINETQTSKQLSSCSSDWYVTGYFIPSESEFSDEFVTIIINEVPREFRQDFVDTIKIEGWGETLSGDYLGWYDDLFHLENNALDLDGEILEVGKIAVDTTIIDHDAKVTIPTLPEPWNETIFIASDEGTSIKGKHIDVFTGAGNDAKEETFRITGYNNEVCIKD